MDPEEGYELNAIDFNLNYAFPVGSHRSLRNLQY